MKIEKKLIISLCLLLSVGSAKSQVTIGSDAPPMAGALLDLKETGETTKGLSMPRVELKTLTPQANKLAESIGGTSGSSPWDEDAHIGLIVYNVKEAELNLVTCKTEGAPIGLHVWDGDRWVGLGTLKGGGTKEAKEAETATTLTDREGNTYQIATFGTAGIWMTENLRTKTAPGMVAMTESASNSETNMYYSYPQSTGTYLAYAIRSAADQALWTEEQGLLYNWYATMNKKVCKDMEQGQGQPNEQTAIIQGICPSGWHVPSDKEWNELEKVISEAPASYATGYPAGSGGTWTETYPSKAAWRGNHSMLMLSTTKVNNAATTEGYSKAKDAGGFNVLLTGSTASNSAATYGNRAHFWLSSTSSGGVSWARYFLDAYPLVGRSWNNRQSMLSVRCKKD